MKAVPWILTLVLALCTSYVLCQSSKKKDTGTSLSDKVQQLVDSTAKRPVCTVYVLKFIILFIRKSENCGVDTYNNKRRRKYLF